MWKRLNQLCGFDYSLSEDFTIKTESLIPRIKHGVIIFAGQGVNAPGVGSLPCHDVDHSGNVAQILTVKRCNRDFQIPFDVKSRVSLVPIETLFVLP